MIAGVTRSYRIRRAPALGLLAIATTLTAANAFAGQAPAPSSTTQASSSPTSPPVISIVRAPTTF
jgi:hypothetical protein